MKAKCAMEVIFPEGKAAESAAAAMSHEGGVGTRSATKVAVDGASLRVEIEAEDVVALRAAANACLRALQAFESVEKEV